MYGPTGVGFLWGKSEILEKMPPWKGGGEMIKEVHMVPGQQPQTQTLEPCCRLFFTGE